MALRLPNQGEQITLEALVNKTAPQDLDLKLFKNDVAHAEALIETGLTEADFTGYAAIQLTAASWVYTGGDPGQVAYPQQTFTSSADQAAQTIYGYYLVQRTSGKLVYYEKFGTAAVIANNGDNIKVTPVITGADTTD